MSDELKAIHDRLMLSKPADAVHGPENCSFCAMADHQTSDQGGHEMADFTQEQVDAMIAQAIKDATDPLQARIAELTDAVKTDEVQAAVAEAVAAKDAEVTDLQAKLDAAEAAKTTAEAALAATEAFWAEAIEAEQAEAAKKVKKAERMTACEELGVFSEEYLAENIDRLTELSDEDFTSRMAEWKLIASKTPPAAKPPTTTAFQASRQAAPDNQGSALHLISDMRRAGEDPRRTA